MKYLPVIAFFFFLTTASNVQSQQSESPVLEDLEYTVREIYNSSRTLLTDLIHTKLEVSFDWNKSYLIGKETLTAKPHFYDTDSLILDAKGMEILKVTLNGKDLQYAYNDGLKLKIQLDRVYSKSERYTVSIDYVSKPDERETSGSSAISSDKGLYFINPKGEETDKMPQIWTQGETESNSVWFPTIDAPNSKTTQEMLITVEDKYVTLSNGNLIDSKKDKDGFRTDHWMQNLPHAPYLFMMAVGEYSIVHDSYTKKDGSKIDVNYYVEPQYEKDARGIFGETPKMIAYFSELLGVEYPWDKYNQIVVRDYVSGAMENTGAVIFGDYVYKDSKDLLDENDQSTIAHELFHHWFGDLVTCESWANLPLNESFANYSQYLWDEYRYGLDEADYQAELEADGYYGAASYQGYHDLIWFDHFDKEDMFDGHSYNKGGRILHMLRNYLGDDAFFQGLNYYLTKNEFQAAEVHHLRLAFEEVCGEDLNWFFNQWFLGKGHLILFTEYKIDKENGRITLKIKQRQNQTDFPVYKIPTQVAIWNGDELVKHKITIDKVEQEFSFDYSGTVSNIQIDHDQVLLAKIYEEKPASYFVHQYYHSKKFKSRRIALEMAMRLHCSNPSGLLADALMDSFWNIRVLASELAGRYHLLGANSELQDKIISLIEKDSVSKVRAAMSSVFISLPLAMDLKVSRLQKMIIGDPSKLVQSNAFSSLVELDASAALSVARQIQKEASSEVKVSIAEVYSQVGEAGENSFFEDLVYTNSWGSEDEIRIMFSYMSYLLGQEIDLMELLPKALSHFQDNGGSYVKMYFTRAVEYCLTSLDEQLEEILEINDGQANGLSKRTTSLINEVQQLLKE
jgi:aminopeptidase N